MAVLFALAATATLLCAGGFLILVVQETWRDLNHGGRRRRAIRKTLFVDAMLILACLSVIVTALHDAASISFGG